MYYLWPLFFARRVEVQNVFDPSWIILRDILLAAPFSTFVELWYAY